MKRIFICSRLKGPTPEDVARNIVFAKQLSLQAALRGEVAVFTPHVLYPAIGLDDSNTYERVIGMHMANAWLRAADEVWVFTKRGISSGMAAEMQLARDFGVPVVQDPRCWEGLE